MLALHSAQAQTFPDKRITLYVSFGPGGPTDLAYRTLAEAASRHLGQRIIVENKPRASATLGAATVARAKPDGYTLAHLSSNVLRMPHMMKTDSRAFPMCLRCWSWVMAFPRARPSAPAGPGVWTLKWWPR
jgi:tripartite-type tricarboxylate transporter receptor subunit TctC